MGCWLGRFPMGASALWEVFLLLQTGGKAGVLAPSWWLRFNNSSHPQLWLSPHQEVSVTGTFSKLHPYGGKPPDKDCARYGIVSKPSVEVLQRRCGDRGRLLANV